MKNKMLLLMKDSFFGTVFSFTIIFLLSFILLNFSFLNPLKKAIKDFSFLDVYYSENFNPSKTVNTDIVIINIEHRDRFELAQLLEIIKTEDPKVIGVDIIFKEKKEAFIDSMLSKALQSDKIITSILIENDEVISSDSFFKNENEPGFINFNFNSKTDVIREFSSVTTHNDAVYKSFPTRVMRAFSEEKWKEYNYDSKLTHDNSIKFHGDYETFLTFGFDEFMANPDKAIVKNKIVLLGYIGTPTGNVYDIEDKHFTPINKVTAGKSNPDMFGIVLHANIVNILLKNDFMFRVSNLWLGIIAFITTFFSFMYIIYMDKKYKISYKSRKKLYLWVFSILFMWLTFLLFKWGIILKTAPIIAVTVLSCSFKKFYKFTVRYIQTKISWKSYL